MENILQNQNNIKWNYFDLELDFLDQIKEKVEKLQIRIIEYYLF